jgi:hypothetical protein
VERLPLPGIFAGTYVSGGKIAIVTGVRRNHADIALWLAWLVPFLIYVFSAYHDVGFWDVGEMDTVPWMLGIPHPTGFPAYVLIGWLFTHIVAIGTVAYRMSLLSLLSMSLTAWLVARTIDDEYQAPWIAMACAWLFAFGDVTWARATRAEVHSVALLAIAATIYCALRVYRTRDRRFLFAGAAAWGLAIGTHPVAVLIAPGVVFLLIMTLVAVYSKRRHVLRAGIFSRLPFAFDTLAAFGLCVAVVAACYAYLPLRSAYVTAHRLDPTQALGLPPGAAFWDYDHPASAAGFRALTTGSDFDVGGGLQAIVTPDVYIHEGARYISAFITEFTVFGAALAILGVIAALTRSTHDHERRSDTAIPALGFVLAGFACIPFALGFSDEADFERYFLTSFFIAAIFAGGGAVWLAQQWRLARTLAPLAVIAISGWLLHSGHGFFNQPHDRRAVAVITNVLAATPSNAIVIASWANATPLAYATYVEGDMAQRTLVAAWIDDEIAYIPNWTASRPVYAVGSADAVIPGYHYEMVANNPQIFRVAKNDATKNKASIAQ